MKTYADKPEKAEASPLGSLKQAFQMGRLSKPDYIEKMYQRHQQLFEYAEFIRDTDIAAIEIQDHQVFITSRMHGIKVASNLKDRRIAPLEALNFGFYEPEETTMLLNLMGSGYTVLDIGANIGWYSLATARHFPDTRIHAFEPILHHFRELQNNIALNGMKNIHPHNMGLSDSPGFLTFYVNPEIGVNASLRNVADANEDQVTTYKCEVRRVDDFVAENDLTVDFIKCDVEGAEFLVLQGAEKTLKTCKPIIMTELLRKWAKKFDYHPNQMIGFLNTIGYEGFYAENGKLIPFQMMDDATIQTNFFFLHSSKHKTLIEQYVKI